jgi:glycosyltransferase involved in cell wall biosynthesis
MKIHNQAALTIIIATLNAESVIRLALESIREQRNAIIDLIIIDGGSNDDTVKIIKSYGSLVDTLITGKDRGIYDAWNKAIPHSKSEWILFMGADDRLANPYVVAQAANSLEALGSHTKIAYARVMQYGSRRPSRLKGESWERSKYKLRSEMCLPHQAVFHSTTFLQETRFDQSYKIAADYKLVLHSLSYGEPAFMENLIFCYQCADGASGQRKNRKLVLEEFRRARKEVGILESKRYWWLYLNGLVWHLLSQTEKSPRLAAINARLRGAAAKKTSN